MAKETAICINVLIRGASLRWWKVVFNQRGMDIITSQGCSIQPTNRILCSAMPFSTYQASLKTAIRRIMSFGLKSTWRPIQVKDFSPEALPVSIQGAISRTSSSLSRARITNTFTPQNPAYLTAVRTSPTRTPRISTRDKGYCISAI